MTINSKIVLFSVILFVLVCSFNTPKVTETKKCYNTLVCNSAPNAKKTMDTYFSSGWQLESVTTQLINFTPSSGIQYSTTKMEREYLIVMYKYK